MVRWMCTRCNFRFEAKSPRECPYCGRDTIKREPSADELLGEIDKILDE